MASIISLIEIKKSYRIGERELLILRGVSLDVNPGEMVAIMGPSGSGKSTLLHIMGALDRPSSGQVLFGKDDVSNMEDATLAHFRNSTMGFIFQNFFLLNTYTAFENVCLPLIYADPPSHRKDRGRLLLEQMGLGNRMNHRPNELSGGERQRVAIARALINDPKVIFADEPTGSLDTKTGTSIMDLLDSIRQVGTTVVLITHDPAVAKRAQRVIHISDGMIL